MLDKTIYILISILTISVVFDMININQTSSYVSKINRYIQLETDKEVSIVKNKFLFMEHVIKQETHMYAPRLTYKKMLQLNPSKIIPQNQKYNPFYFTNTIDEGDSNILIIDQNNFDIINKRTDSNIYNLNNLLVQEKLIDRGISVLNGTGFCGLTIFRHFRDIQDSIYVGSRRLDLRDLSSKLEVYLNDSLVGTSSHLSITIPQQKNILLTTHYIAPSLDYTNLDTMINIKKYQL